MKRTRFVAILALLLVPANVLAVTADALKNIQYDAVYYDANSTCNTGTVAAVSGSNITGPAWNSGLQPPYYLEEFAIEMLKDIAAKRGVDQSQTVTQEHVVDLVGWMWAEGGDINGHTLFNPLNTGQGDPGFVAGAHSGSGVQSYVSFDAGVEETTRGLVAPLQNRLVGPLTNPNSTTTDFVQALTYFQKYPGNRPWAEADDPANGGNQQQYYNTILASIQQAARNYTTEAATIIGTPAQEAQTGQRVPASQLKFNGSSISVNGSVSNGCSNGPGAVAGDILQTALNFSWPEPYDAAVASGAIKNEPGRTGPKSPRQAFADALAKINPGAPFGGADCGSFVSAVIRSSGADPNYPLVGTIKQGRYVVEHPELYDIKYDITSTADLQPGDILILNQGSHLDATGHYIIPDTGNPGSGHTEIYVGPQAGGYNAASSSLNDYEPRLGVLNLTDSRGFYMRVRIKK